MTTPIENRLGVCSWSLRPDNPHDLVALIKTAGLSRVQLGLVPLCNDAAVWGDTPALLSDAGITIASGMTGTVGEDYSSIEAIRRTGGVVPDDTWPASRELALKVLDKAAQLALPLVTFHAGFIPEDTAHPAYAKARDRLRELADYAGERNIELGLETGQETSEALAAFLSDLDRPNVGANFDPANMLLYSSGDPVEAVQLLMSHLKQVHIKDATPSGDPEQWGAEVTAGTGAVDWPAFAAALREGGYEGNLMIEREAGDDRVGDIAKARAMVLNVFA